MVRDIFIFDIDGTLADIDHRLHLVKCDRPDWDAFFNACVADKPIESTIRVLQSLIETDAEIWIWSGRNEDVRGITEEMLEKWGVGWDELKMRPSDSRMSDDKLKQQWLDDLDADEIRRVRAVFEDRDRVVAMWRRNRIPCFQVAPGDF